MRNDHCRFVCQRIFCGAANRIKDVPLAVRTMGIGVEIDLYN